MTRVFTWILIIIIGLMIFWFKQSVDHDRISTWAKENNYTIIKKDLTLLDYGPFYYKDDGQEIYKVIVKDKNQLTKVFYFRIGLFSEIEEYK